MKIKNKYSLIAVGLLLASGVACIALGQASIGASLLSVAAGGAFIPTPVVATKKPKKVLLEVEEEVTKP